MNFFKSKSQKYKKSYSQSGEDVIIKFIFNSLGIKKISYIDIGAHDPFYLNNTAIFYKTGNRGINIEPDPILFKNFEKFRKRDINLNIGISDETGKLDFYIMDSPTLNSFSKDEAERYEREYKFKIKRTIKVNVDKVSNIINRYSKNEFPDLLSLDVEGLDQQILHSIDFNKSKPKVICVETISYSETHNGVKNTQLIEFLKSRGYIVYADTYINTIFVDEEIWVRSK
jgi:FkbM family methyltransferase